MGFQLKSLFNGAFIPIYLCRLLWKSVFEGVCEGTNIFLPNSSPLQTSFHVGGDEK